MLLKTNTEGWELIWPQSTDTCLQTPTGQVSVEHWLNDVQAAQHWLQANPGRVLLYRRDVYPFSVWLMALLSVGRSVVLPSNDKPATLHELRADYDVIAPEKPPKAAQHSPTRQLSGPLNTTLTFFTSGSSGTPKPVVKQLRQLFNEVATLERTFAHVIEKSQVLATVTHQHIYGLLFTVLWPLCTGRVIHSELVTYPEQLTHAVAHAQNNKYLLVASPAHLQRLDNLKELSQYGTALTAVFSSGGPLPEQVPADFSEHDMPIPIEVYGSTETGGIAWRQRTNHDDHFTPLYGVEVELTEEQTLTVRSPYLPNTNEPFLTEDKARLGTNGRFQLLGRNDRVVKIAEKRVSLTEIERFMRSHDWVDQVAACIVEGERQTIGLVMVLSPAGNAALNDRGRFTIRQSVRHYLQQRFDKVVTPKRFRYVAALPINGAGKVTQAALQQLFTVDDEGPIE